MVLFEGVGVGLLVPLMSLLLGGTNATPMRPIQWLQTAFPHHSPAFYVGVCCVAIVIAIAVEERCRLHRADVRGAAQAPGRDQPARGAVQPPAGGRSRLVRSAARPARSPTSSWSRPTAPPWRSKRRSAFVQRASIALFYVGALFYISWPLTSMVVVLGVAARRRAQLRSIAASATPGTRLTDLNHRVSTILEQSFAGVRVVRATNAQAAEIERFQRGELRAGRERGGDDPRARLCSSP